MTFYTKKHRYYCGIDLHARSMYLCVLGQDGEVVLHQNIPAQPEPFLTAIALYRDDIAVVVECIFTWYWIADLCASEGITFILGHALYMKAVHGGKAKNDKIDSRKIGRALARRDDCPGLRLPSPDARHPRSAPTSNLPGTP